MATSLVTGGAGFIGSHVAGELTKAGHSVIILDDLSGGFTENIPANCQFVHGSILDTALLGRLFQEHKIDYVYHLAAYAAEGLSHFIKRFNYQNNLIGSVNLINESILHKVKCFVFTSSIAVYGKGQLPMHEDLTPLPEDPYGIAKYAVEQELKSSHEMFGLNYIIFRPHNVYGENQNIGDKYRNVVGIFMNQLLQNKPLTIFGDGSQTRAFSYVADVARTVAQSIDFPEAINQVFNIGSDVPVSLNDLAKAVCAAMGKDGQIRYVDARNEVPHAYADHSKSRKIFKLRNPVELKEGLIKMTDWVKVHGARKVKSFEFIELKEGLPPLWLE